MKHLGEPFGIAIHPKDGRVFVAYLEENEIFSWNPETQETRSLLENIKHPSDLLIDTETNSLVIAASGSQKIIRFHLDRHVNKTETIIEKINCSGLAIDGEGNIFTTILIKNEVRRVPKAQNLSMIVAGGNGKGTGLHQFNDPAYVTIDREESLYITDTNNHRIVKWVKGAKRGIVVAGSGEPGSKDTQLYNPHGIVTDVEGNLFIADCFNHRILRFRKGSKIAEILLDSSQLTYPRVLSFDHLNNLYVGDNHGVQRFSVVE